MLGMLNLFKYCRRSVHKMYILNMDLGFKKGSSSKIKFVESSGSRWDLKCVCVWKKERRKRKAVKNCTSGRVCRVGTRKQGRSKEMSLESSTSRVNLLLFVEHKVLSQSFVFTWHPIALQRALWKKNVIDVRY